VVDFAVAFDAGPDIPASNTAILHQIKPRLDVELLDHVHVRLGNDRALWVSDGAGERARVLPKSHILKPHTADCRKCHKIWRYC
jgi:hypothetical protein